MDDQSHRLAILADVPDRAPRAFRRHLDLGARGIHIAPGFGQPNRQSKRGIVKRMGEHVARARRVCLLVAQAAQQVA